MTSQVSEEDEEEDEDVLAERLRIASGATDLLTIRELTKV